MIGVWSWRGPSRQAPGATPRRRDRSGNRIFKSPAVFRPRRPLGQIPLRRDRKVAARMADRFEPTGAFRSSRRCRAAPKPALLHSVWKRQSCSGIILARSNSTLARPYIARLSVFNRLIWPSTWPLLQGSRMAFRTASISGVTFSRNSAWREARNVVRRATIRPASRCRHLEAVRRNASPVRASWRILLTPP